MLLQQRSQFRQDQPCVVAAGDHSKRADVPNFVFQTAGGHGRNFVLGKVPDRNKGEPVFVVCPTDEVWEA